MSSIGGIGLGGQQWLAERIQQLQQKLFSKIDTNSDGAITQSELENAVNAGGGTTQAADALYALLDPNKTGSVSKQQFAQNLPTPPFSDQMGAQLIAVQSQQSGGTAAGGAGAFAQNLFNQIDGDGDGAITQAELENAVTAAGGSKAAADALYAKLDPNNTGSVSEQQFAQSLSQVMPHHHHHHRADQDADGDTGGSGSSAQDALAALINGAGNGAGPTQLAQTIFSQIDANGDGSITQSELENAVTAAGGTTQAADALFAQLDPSNTGSVSEASFAASLQPPSATGNTAQDALLALINGVAPNSTASANSATTTSSDSSPQDALFALLNDLGTNNSTATTTSGTNGTSAQDALFALLQSNGGNWADGWGGIASQDANGQNLASMVSLFDTLGQSTDANQRLLGSLFDAVNRGA